VNADDATMQVRDTISLRRLGLEDAGAPAAAARASV
jgi:hypothetical protein